MKKMLDKLVCLLYVFSKPRGRSVQTQKITIPGSIRSKKNSKRIVSCGSFKKILPSTAYMAWEAQARAGALPTGKPLTCPVSVEAHFYYRGARPDLSGAMESIADAMQGLLWVDDRQIESWDGSRMHHDKENPRTEITVRWPYQEHTNHADVPGVKIRIGDTGDL